MNKFNAPLSTRVMAYLLIGLSFVAILSCRKEIINLVRDPIAMAHEQFDQKAKQISVEANGNSMLSNSLLLKRQPDWKRAFSQKSGDSIFVFVPINLPANLTLKIGGKQGTNLNDLMLLRMSDTGKGFDADRAEMITLLPEIEWKPGQTFQGKLITENWFVPDRHFTSLAPKTKPGGITAFGLVECVTTVVDECIGAGDGETCTPNSQTTCSGYGDGGGGGGGGVPSTPPASGGSHSGGGSSTAANENEAFNRKIDTTQLKPCMKQVLKSINNLQNGSIPKIIRLFSGNAPGYNWKLVDGVLPAGTNGRTDGNYNGGIQGVVTTFDSQKYTAASDLAIARTIMHESVHAFLVDYFHTNTLMAQATYPELVQQWINTKNPSLNDIQHDDMVNTFIGQIASSLAEYGDQQGYTFSTNTEKTQFYNDLAWGGLTNTNAFNNFPTATKARINDRLLSEQYQTDTNGNSKPSKGKKGGC